MMTNNGKTETMYMHTRIPVSEEIRKISSGDWSKSYFIQWWWKSIFWSGHPEPCSLWVFTCSHCSSLRVPVETLTCKPHVEISWFSFIYVKYLLSHIPAVHKLAVRHGKIFFPLFCFLRKRVFGEIKIHPRTILFPKDPSDCMRNF